MLVPTLMTPHKSLWNYSLPKLMLLELQKSILILVNPLPGVETNIYLVCRFTGLRVGWLAGLLICLSAMFKAAGVQVAVLLVSWLAGWLVSSLVGWLAIDATVSAFY